MPIFYRPSKHRLLMLVFAVLPLLLIACTANEFATQIVFYANEEIYLMNADGSDVRQLTANDWIDVMPVWSPDKTRIAFFSQDDGVSDIYIMNADGSNALPVTNDWDVNPHASWSADGEQLAYSLPGRGADIFITNIALGRARQLTTTDATAIEFDPVWSPDGTQIAFTLTQAADTEIYLMNADGSNIRQLTNAEGPARRSESPAWSPDGQAIAFVSNRTGNDDLFIINADGSELRQLTDHQWDEILPAWSPDGQQLALSADLDGDFEIVVINLDGEIVTQLTDNDVDDFMGDW